MATTTAKRPETRANLRYLGQSPTKVRQVLDLIRGKEIDEARRILQFCERGAAEPVRKLLDSAIANADNNDNLPTDELFVQTAFADEAPVQKRFRTRARGRGTRILKRVSHVTIGVARLSDKQLEIRSRAEEASGGGAQARRSAQMRQRRVEQSKKAQRTAERVAAEEHDHDHDHDEDHDHEHETDEVPTDEVETDAVGATSDIDAEATGTTEPETKATDAAVDTDDTKDEA
jgi:large subunit ribosomal protein L22